MSRQLHSDMANRGSIAANTGLASCPLARYDSSSKERREYRANITPTLSNLQCLHNLPLDLRLARYQRVEAAGHSKEMSCCLLISQRVAEGFQLSIAHLSTLAQRLQ